MSSPLPSSAQPMGQTQDGKPVFMSRVFQQFLNSLVSAAPASIVTSLSPTPASITAGGSGNYLVVGGTVTDITLTRGNTVIPTGLTGGFIPVANGDVVSITYSAPPTVTFVPS